MMENKRNINHSILTGIIPIIALFSLFLTGNCAGGPPNLEIGNAWVAEALPGKKITAAYLTIANSGGEADELLSVTSEASRVVEIHKMVHEAGVMRMEQVKGVTIPPGGKVAFRPGSIHLMLIDVDESVKNGNSITLNFNFKTVGSRAVKAVVKRRE